MALNYYVVLGVPPAANPSQIRRAYRRLVLQYHPDRAGDEYVDRFCQVQDAYAALMDEQSRAEYDRELRREEQSGSAPPREPPISLEPIDLFSTLSRYDPSRGEILAHFTRNFSDRGAPKTNPVRDLNLELVLSPEEARRSGRVPIDVPVGTVCPRCDGTGITGFYHCEMCGGHGMNWQKARVDVLLSPPVRDGTTIPVSLRQVGVNNLNLKVCVHVSA